jgi:hypothetical protein
VFLELAKFASLLLSILSLDAVFHAAFLAPASQFDQRLQPGFEALLLSAAVCLGSGAIFRAWEMRLGRRDVRLAATLPMLLFWWGSSILILLFFGGWVLDRYFFGRKY